VVSELCLSKNSDTYILTETGPGKKAFNHGLPFMMMLGAHARVHI
jgi:hypothetical protein